MLEESKRGRPSGTGKNEDLIVLMQIARLRERSPDENIATSIRQLVGRASEADIRRIRRKWRSQGASVAARIDLIEDRLALSSLSCSRSDWDALLRILETLPARRQFGQLDATAVIALASSLRFGSIMEEALAVTANPALGMVRRIGSRKRRVAVGNFAAVTRNG